MQKRVEQFVEHHNLQYPELVRYADLVSEIGELGKELVRGTDYGKHPLTGGDGIAEELGDCMFSLLALCSALGVDAQKALSDAMDKYDARIRTRSSADSGR